MRLRLPILDGRRARALCAAALLGALVAGCGRATGSSSGGPDVAWPTYGGTFANTRHAELHDIDPSNVASLKLAWKFQTGVAGQNETSPVVAGGRMYVTTGLDDAVYALDPASGALLWRYVPAVGYARYAFRVNRGVAVDGGRVFHNTIDDHLIALDARTGKPLWNVKVGNPRDGLSEDSAPLAWHGLVFVGSSGGEFGLRGSFSAYSQNDGKLAWRWWSVSPGWEGTFRNEVHGYALHRDLARERASVARYRDAWKAGGGPVWMTPALGTDDATIYLSTGNPAPDYNAERRPGDNLYTDSIVALDARSGRMRWYYQETPHDTWDYDASSPPVLIDALDATGRRIPAVAEAGKTGWLYVVNRKTGALIRVSQPFVPQPHVYDPPTAAGAKAQPGDTGGAIGPIAYDPAAHAAFVAGNVDPESVSSTPIGPWNAASEDQWEGGAMTELTDGAGAITSVDADSGRIRWSTSVPDLLYGGPLSTGGLVFVGDTRSGTFRALDETSGAVLWNAAPRDTPLARFDVRDRTAKFVSSVKRGTMRLWHRLRHIADYGDEDIHAPPIAYRIGGREYVVIMSDQPPAGNTVYAFALP